MISGSLAALGMISGSLAALGMISGSLAAFCIHFQGQNCRCRVPEEGFTYMIFCVSTVSNFIKGKKILLDFSNNKAE
jgi:hypothetical protein